MNVRRPQIVSDRLFVEPGEQAFALVAEVAPILRIDRTYSYHVPNTMKEQLSLGHRVQVPIGRRARLVIGFVVALDCRPWDTTLRPIHSLVDQGTFLTPDLIDVAREISAHYRCPLGPTLKAITPQAVRERRGMKKVSYARLGENLRAFLVASPAGLEPDAIEWPVGRLTPARRALLSVLAASTDPVPVDDLLKTAGSSAVVLRGLVKAGFVDFEVRTQPSAEELQPPSQPQAEPTFSLNAEQQSAIDAIFRTVEEARFGVTLLWGVAGSGKTEVYIRAIRRVIEMGRQAIFLVPEIVLTTQLVSRLVSRFPGVAVQHSGLSESQRAAMWRRIAAGERQVVIGTRSAVFAPCPKLGLIVVDEEQEGSFKNLQSPRFHVRDAAIMRAKTLGIPVVLGSATPSLETWHRSEQHRDYRRLVLSRRVNDLPMPKVHLVDMEAEFAELKRPVVLSRLMERLLGETLDRGEQAILLMNRRGYATRVFCPTCRTRITCPTCSVGLVVHAGSREAMCHYCLHRMPVPIVCPKLGCGERLVQFGLGTQRVEEVVAQRFPDARILRVDSDTMRHRSQYEQVIRDFEERRVDVLVGTQMIAKGLDFPMVSLVGVIDAEPSALSADFRAHERLFQLITQVAGRAGRADAPGQVVVQTADTTLPALRWAVAHDFAAFARQELSARQRIGWPPFRRLARIVVAHQRERTAQDAARALLERIYAAGSSPSYQRIEKVHPNPAEGLTATPNNIQILGPNPCALARLRSLYRYELLVLAPDAAALRSLLAQLESDGAFRTQAKSCIVDVDPVSFS
ncbi:MAG: primosomal protein N' [Planctomycetota bacterium]